VSAGVIPQHLGAFLVFAHGDQCLAERRTDQPRDAQKADTKQGKSSQKTLCVTGQVNAPKHPLRLLDDKAFIAARVFAEVQHKQIERLGKHQRCDHESRAHSAQRQKADHRRQGRRAQDANDKSRHQMQPAQLHGQAKAIHASGEEHCVPEAQKACVAEQNIVAHRIDREHHDPAEIARVIRRQHDKKHAHQSKDCDMQ